MMNVLLLMIECFNGSLYKHCTGLLEWWNSGLHFFGALHQRNYTYVPHMCTPNSRQSYVQVDVSNFWHSIKSHSAVY